MFPTFTGSSRRPRNVNLSGQNINPFAASGWAAPSNASGATRTVSLAQAERQQRQAERQKLKATTQIQRLWRGHRVRRGVRASRRDLFDALYASNPETRLEPSERLAAALPLLTSSFRSQEPGDLDRLYRLSHDAVSSTSFESTVRSALCFKSQTRLATILVDALCNESLSPEIQLLLLRLVTRLSSCLPDSLAASFPKYYQYLAALCQLSSLGTELANIVLDGVLKPLVAVSVPPTGKISGLNGDIATSDPAYDAFAFSFLVAPNLVLFEPKIAHFANLVNTERLSTAIYRGCPSSISQEDDIFWLLAHFIGFVNGEQVTEMSTLRSLHCLLSMVAPTIRIQVTDDGSAISESQGEESDTEPSDPPRINKYLSQPLPKYVMTAILSLVDKDVVSKLLGVFSKNSTLSSTDELEVISLLSGYLLVLLRCFPNQSDDIRMRLYLGDVPSEKRKTPTLRFLWNAVARSSIYRAVVTDDTAPIKLLKSYFSAPDNLQDPIGDSQHDREWRIILLFLELYVFILRLSDDEDFFGAIHPNPLQDEGSDTRIRKSSLPLRDVESLTWFLKNLAFALHHDTAQITGSLATARRMNSKQGITRASQTSTAIGTRLDFDSTKDIITTAIRMLYERDSRRPFLPPGHWLMTSRFDMRGFITDVVVEQQRQQDLSGESESEEDEDTTDDQYPWTSPRTSQGQRLSHHARIERLQNRQRRVQRERFLASIGPKLEILRHMPFVIPFETRVQIFRQFVYLDKMKRREGHVDADQWRLAIRNSTGFDHLQTHQATIRRGQVFADAFTEFYPLGEGLKEPIQITFQDQFGANEAGIDGGGVTKEFLTTVIDEAFGNEVEVWFSRNDQTGCYFPNPGAIDWFSERARHPSTEDRISDWPSSEQASDLEYMDVEDERNNDMDYLDTKTLSPPDMIWGESSEQRIQQQKNSKDMVDMVLKRYEFLGRIVGKCMYEGILLNISFAGFFLLKWTDPAYRGNVNDLRDIDEDLYHGLLALKKYTGDVEHDLDIDFTIVDTASFYDSKQAAKTYQISRNLIPGGDKVAVTNEKRLLYISYVARHRLVVQPRQQTAAFLKGLRTIIHPSWLSMFNQVELQTLVGGDSSEIDVEDLRLNTMYSGVYQIGTDGLEHHTVQLFWKVMAGFTDQQRRDVLKYVTSTPRAPLLGFSQLSPKFSIRDGGSDESRLPSTSTCVNLLKLPVYTTEEKLREKLLYAITSGAGFDLS